MSIVARFLAVVTEPQFKLARDLTAMAIADGQITPEEKEAISAICHLEGIDESHLLQSLQGGYEKVQDEMPKDRKGKDNYLRGLISLIGADEYVAPQEVFLFQIIASKMGLNQMDVIGLFLMTANRRYFKGDIGAKVLHSFLKNHIDPKGKNERDNRECLRRIYETIAENTERLQDVEADRELLRQNLERATESFMENHILINEFQHMRLDFARMLKEEELKVLKKYQS
jgi:hypothetical protein